MSKLTEFAATGERADYPSEGAPDRLETGSRPPVASKAGDIFDEWSVGPLLPHEIQALEFLALGPDNIGVIDSEEKLAAACVFVALERRGLVANDRIDGEVWASITPAGRAALASPGGQDDR